MLRRLTLRDFVIVTSLEVDLSGGFTALTGETGAGKSILIDALQLALGSRATPGWCARARRVPTSPPSSNPRRNWPPCWRPGWKRPAEPFTRLSGAGA